MESRLEGSERAFTLWKVAVQTGDGDHYLTILDLPPRQASSSLAPCRESHEICAVHDGNYLPKP